MKQDPIESYIWSFAMSSDFWPTTFYSFQPFLVLVLYVLLLFMALVFVMKVEKWKAFGVANLAKIVAVFFVGFNIRVFLLLSSDHASSFSVGSVLLILNVLVSGFIEASVILLALRNISYWRLCRMCMIVNVVLFPVIYLDRIMRQYMADSDVISLSEPEKMKLILASLKYWILGA